MSAVWGSRLQVTLVGDFPAVPGAKTSPSSVCGGGVWGPSLVGEIRSHIPSNQETKTLKKKQTHKQYCDKFNKDFKKWFIPVLEHMELCLMLSGSLDGRGVCIE